MRIEKTFVKMAIRFYLALMLTGFLLGLLHHFLK